MIYYESEARAHVKSYSITSAYRNGANPHEQWELSQDACYAGPLPVLARQARRLEADDHGLRPGTQSWYRSEKEVNG